LFLASTYSGQQDSCHSWLHPSEVRLHKHLELVWISQVRVQLMVHASIFKFVFFRLLRHPTIKGTVFVYIAVCSDWLHQIQCWKRGCGKLGSQITPVSRPFKDLAVKLCPHSWQLPHQHRPCGASLRSCDANGVVYYTACSWWVLQYAMVKAMVPGFQYF